MEAQSDTTYIKTFDLGFCLKPFIDQKISYFQINSSQTDSSEKIENTIRTNRNPSIGIGITLRDYSISISKSLGFLGDNSRGNTKTIDFEYHGYKRTFIYDFFLQYHRGYYESVHTKHTTSYVTFPNLSTYFYGGNLYYVFNHDHFSYRAIFNQNEIQKKSSGSLLAGAAAYYSIIKSDSTLIFIDNIINNKHKNLQFGVSAGYAYTWVVSPRMQISASGTVGVNIGNDYPEDFFKYKLLFYPTVNTRFGAVYNKRDISFGLTIVHNMNHLYFRKEDFISYNNTQIQFCFVKRFNWKNSFVNRKIDQINSVKNRIGFLE